MDRLLYSLGLDRFRMKLSIFYRFMEDLASLSNCKRARRGCIIVDPNLTDVLAIGYNGPPSGESNNACRSQEGSCGCIHGEANALIKLQTRTDGLILICSSSPCEHCAGLIVNSKRIGLVIYGDKYRDETGLGLLVRSSILVECWEKIKNPGQSVMDQPGLEEPSGTAVTP